MGDVTRNGLPNPGVAGESFTLATWERIIEGEPNALYIWLRYKEASARFFTMPEHMSSDGSAAIARVVGGDSVHMGLVWGGAAVARVVSLGVIEKVGELCNHFKNAQYQLESFSPAVLLDVLGDICWYMARTRWPFKVADFHPNSYLSYDIHDELYALARFAGMREYHEVLMRVVRVASGLGFTLIDVLGRDLVKRHHHEYTTHKGD